MPTKTPKHLWIIAILSLVWNLGGVVDFTYTQMRDEVYLAKFTPEQLELFLGFPLWLVIFWGIAVWSSLLGGVLLLMRHRYALPVFQLSLLAMVVTAIHNFGFTNTVEILGRGAIVFTSVIFFISLMLVLYAWWMKRAGVLR